MRFSLLPIILLTLSFAIFAQQPTLSSTPDEADVVKISTSLIQIDATVTDKKGNIVKDLTADDFEIYENNIKQTVTNFSFVELRSEQSSKESIPIAPNKLKREQVRRTMVFVVDNLRLSFQSMMLVRQALKRFVDEQMQPNDLVAIVRTAGDIGLMQQFTNDKRQLYAAIERMRWYPPGIARSAAGYEEEGVIIGTLGTLGYIVGGMRQLPGRKTLFFLSDGLKLDVTDQAGTISDDGQIVSHMQRLTELANRTSVIINTIDMRGLVAAGQPGGQTLAEADSLFAALPGPKFYQTQEGLLFLADKTGGQAFVNSNNIQSSIRTLLEDQKDYYLLAYQPDESVFDPKKRKYNKLEIRMKRPDLKVRYRSGFFGLSDQDFGLSDTSSQQTGFLNALASPFAAGDIEIRLNALFSNDAVQGNFIRALIHVQAKDLKFTDEPDGTKKAVFDIAALTFGENGVPVDTVNKTYTVAADANLYKEWQENGFTYQITLPVKKPGAYQFRAGLYDEQASKSGTASQFIIVPDLKNNRLSISGIGLQAITAGQVKILTSGNVTNEQLKANADAAQTDTALRRFRPDRLLQFNYIIYNARLNSANTPQLTAQTRLFYDGKIYLEGKPTPLDPGSQNDKIRLKFNGAIALPAEMKPGEYVLQVTIIDSLAEDKNKTVTQLIDFEIIK
jgi:VWFA-related protein